LPAQGHASRGQVLRRQVSWGQASVNDGLKNTKPETWLWACKPAWMLEARGWKLDGD